MKRLTRRHFSRTMLATCVATLMPCTRTTAQARAPAVSAEKQPWKLASNRPSELSKPPLADHLREIPSSGEILPSVGMGTWLTFDVSDIGNVKDQRAKVLQTFFDHGGAMVDSSPMYGRSEAVIGYCLDQIDNKSGLFSASKIWTPMAFDGVSQMASSERLWRVPGMDLMYVHNLLNWRSHLPQLREWKEQGRIRYIGVSTSHGRRHEELERIIKTETLDFVQLTYNYENRKAANRLIPLAQDKGMAVVINRPFGRGQLIRKYQNQVLPGLAKDLGCESWAQYLLLFAVALPGVTTAIPATTRVDHMLENMGVMDVAIPDAAVYQKM